MASSNTNTGERFISRSKQNCIKVKIPTLDGKCIYRSVGIINRGEKAALKRAVEIRDECGRKEWGEHWDLILSDQRIFMRLPSHFEPREKNGEFHVEWTIFENGKASRHHARKSFKKHGKLQAYIQCKQIKIEGYRKYIPLMLYMGLITEKDLNV